MLCQTPRGAEGGGGTESVRAGRKASGPSQPRLGLPLEQENEPL